MMFKRSVSVRLLAEKSGIFLKHWVPKNCEKLPHRFAFYIAPNVFNNNCIH